MLFRSAETPRGRTDERRLWIDFGGALRCIYQQSEEEESQACPLRGPVRGSAHERRDATRPYEWRRKARLALYIDAMDRRPASGAVVPAHRGLRWRDHHHADMMYRRPASRVRGSALTYSALLRRDISTSREQRRCACASGDTMARPRPRRHDVSTPGEQGQGLSVDLLRR